MFSAGKKFCRQTVQGEMSNCLVVASARHSLPVKPIKPSDLNKEDHNKKEKSIKVKKSDSPAVSSEDGAH